jgi:hypothetical protein
MYLNTAVLASARVQNRPRYTNSLLRVAKKLSTTLWTGPRSIIPTIALAAHTTRSVTRPIDTPQHGADSGNHRRDRRYDWHIDYPGRCDATDQVPVGVVVRPSRAHQVPIAVSLLCSLGLRISPYQPTIFLENKSMTTAVPSRSQIQPTLPPVTAVISPDVGDVSRPPSIGHISGPETGPFKLTV